MDTASITQMDIETKRFCLALWLQTFTRNRVFFDLASSGRSLAELFADPIWVKEQLGYTLLPPDWAQVDEILAWGAQPNHHVLLIQEDLYPESLRQISLPPPVLLVLGDPHILTDPQIAMVGSRQMSRYGQKIAFEWASQFAKMGITVTSGLAYGVDAEAHKGALAGGGHTIGVLGSGIEVLYPQSHCQLAKNISQSGCILSEFPLKYPASAFTFPRRNRIISALSLGVVVVEAGYKSGSLITARYAMEQGKEVFAVPGCLNNPVSQGCHWLIQQGAHCVTEAQEVVLNLKKPLEFSLSSPHIPTEMSNKNKILDPKISFSKEYLDLLSYIDYDITPVGVILERMGGSIQVLSSMLLMLELQGKIQAVPGGYIKLKEETVL